MLVLSNFSTGNCSDSLAPLLKTEEVDVVLLGVGAVIMGTTFFTAGLPLLAFYKQPSLRNSFTTYVIVLLISDLLTNTVTVTASWFIRAPGSSLTQDSVRCFFAFYGYWTLAGVSSAMHVVIAGNRMWALYYPITYRRNHTEKVSVVLSVGTIVGVHALSMPFVLTTLYSNQECRANTGEETQTLMTVNVFLLFDIPIAFLVLSFLVIGSKVTFLALTREKIFGVNRVANERPRLDSQTSKDNGEHNKVLLLALMTFTYVVFWAPSRVITSVESLVGYWDNSKTYDLVADCLYLVQFVVDPLIFVYSLGTLRKACLKLCQKWLRWVKA